MPWYPLGLVRAITLIWLFSGLRTDEIMRLRVGAIRWQHPPGEADTARVCLLDVPVNKTSTAFTKPVDPLVGDAIERWEAARPAHPKFTDGKTGELVDLLFCFRGQTLASDSLNRVLVDADADAPSACTMIARVRMPVAARAVASTRRSITPP